MLKIYLPCLAISLCTLDFFSAFILGILAQIVY